MAEVFKTTETGETTQHFIQFIIMQQQQALLALGRHPNPPPGAPLANLGLAKAFIDQLGAIRVRTEGNLTSEERTLLNTVLTGLQTSYVEVTRAGGEEEEA
jgi:hypothetical protein